MAANDPLFGIHASALEFQRQRMELLSSNIANADTPGYVARDLDFSKVLALAAQQKGDDAGAAGAPSIDAASLSAATVYRVPLQPAVDGNTVDLQVEQGQFTDAAMHYQASLSFIDARLRSLIAAIGGQG